LRTYLEICSQVLQNVSNIYTMINIPTVDAERRRELQAQAIASRPVSDTELYEYY